MGYFKHLIKVEYASRTVDRSCRQAASTRGTSLPTVLLAVSETSAVTAQNSVNH